MGIPPPTHPHSSICQPPSPLSLVSPGLVQTGLAPMAWLSGKFKGARGGQKVGGGNKSLCGFATKGLQVKSNPGGTSSGAQSGPLRKGGHRHGGTGRGRDV